MTIVGFSLRNTIPDKVVVNQHDTKLLLKRTLAFIILFPNLILMKILQVFRPVIDIERSHILSKIFY